MSENVRKLGFVEDIEGNALFVGVDRDRVTIGPMIFSLTAAEDFARLFISATWQAGQQMGREQT